MLKRPNEFDCRIGDRLRHETLASPQIRLGSGEVAPAQPTRSSNVNCASDLGFDEFPQIQLILQRLGLMGKSGDKSHIGRNRQPGQRRVEGLIGSWGL